MPRKTSTAKPSKSRPVATDNPNTAPTTLRLDPALVDALDKWAGKLNAGGIGPQWTRADLIRAALWRAVKDRGEKGEAP